MYSRFFNICRTSAYQTSNKFEIARRLCQKTGTITGDTCDDSIRVSKKFPDYKVIYIFRFARIARIATVLNRLTTGLNIAAISSCTALCIANVLPLETAFTISSIVSVYNLSFFGMALYCRNVIVYIYFNDEGEKVIISYVNLWGKRVDVHTTVSDLPHFGDISGYFDRVYKTIFVPSHTQPLKFPVKFAEFIDKKRIEYLFGKP